MISSTGLVLQVDQEKKQHLKLNACNEFTGFLFKLDQGLVQYGQQWLDECLADWLLII